MCDHDAVPHSHVIEDGYDCNNAVVVSGYCWAAALFNLLLLLNVINLLLLGTVALRLNVGVVRQTLPPFNVVGYC